MSDPISQRLLDAALQFVVPLRTADRHDEVEFQELCSALRACAKEWQDADTLPRTAVALMIDLFPAILATAEFYSGSEEAKINESAYLVLDLMMTAAYGREHDDSARLLRDDLL